MGDNLRSGTRRAAHALVHLLGAGSIQLQMPALPVADDDGEELGLASPQFQLKQVVPAALRQRNDATEALVPADALEEELGVQGLGAVTAALSAIAGVQAGDELYVVRGVEPVFACGGECLYRLLLQQPATEVV